MNPLVFDDLDRMVAANGSAAAVLVCASDVVLTVVAGGPGVLSSEVEGVHTAYEVRASQSLGGPWNRYAGDVDDGSYGLVPRMLLVHEVARQGGIAAPVRVSPRTPKRRVVVEVYCHEEQTEAAVARVAEAFAPVGSVRLGAVSVQPA